MQETQEKWVWFLGREDPLEKEMATHSSILCQENSMRRSPWATVHGVSKSQTEMSDWAWVEKWAQEESDWVCMEWDLAIKEDSEEEAMIKGSMLGQEEEWTSCALRVNDLSSLVAGYHWVTDLPYCYQRWGERKWQRPSGEGIGVKGSCAVLFPKLKNEHCIFALLVRLHPVSLSPPSSWLLPDVSSA